VDELHLASSWDDGSDCALQYDRRQKLEKASAYLAPH
jgi:hypothetical protein